MLNTKKIESAMSTSNITKAQLCQKACIGRPTLDAILRGSDAKISTIESISKVLNVKVGFLFDEEVTEIREAGRDYVESGKIEHKGSEYNGSVAFANEADLRDQIAQLKSQLADKERIIKLMEEKR